MEDSNPEISKKFGPILDSLVDGKTYDDLPPRGPNDLPIASISDRELSAIDQDTFGEEKTTSSEEDDTEGYTSLVEPFAKKLVEMPTEDTLDGINVIGIVGDNKRVLTTSFHFILSRVATINFRYTKGYDRPYFYSRTRDAYALMVLDVNIFNPDYSIYTYNNLISGANGSPILDHLKQNKDNKPFTFKYDYERIKKAPSSQSLGMAVKFQHSLELLCVDDIELDKAGVTVCLKEGALFSNSTHVKDIQNGLKSLLAWRGTSKFFIGMSTQVAETRVLIRTLEEHPHLIEDYFPNQHIPLGTIKSFGTDSLLLKKILKPGERTALVEYIEPTRAPAIADPELAGLKPVTCYYHKRSKPYSFVRIEMPKFMWEGSKNLAESAISIALWQYELGGNEPLVLKAARDRSNLEHERWAIEQQMKAAVENKDLKLIEFLDLQ